jgi:hypothetical protein
MRGLPLAACLVQVLTAGAYSATAMYTSNIQATFRLSVGTYADIQAGRARSLTVQLPAQVSVIHGCCKVNYSKEGFCLVLLAPTLTHRHSVHAA